MLDTRNTHFDYAGIQSVIARIWQVALASKSESFDVYRVAYDAPSFPDVEMATYAAIKTVAVTSRHPRLLEWFTRHIRNVVVHCARRSESIDIVNNELHLFSLTEEVDPWSASLRLFDRLTDEQRRDYTRLAPLGQVARENFAGVFTWIASRSDRDAQVRELIQRKCRVMPAWLDHEIAADEDWDAFIREVDLMVAMNPTAAGPGDVRLRDWPPLRTLIEDRFRTSPQSNPTRRDVSEQWPAEVNRRRVDLIDKYIEGTITGDESLELAVLQRQALDYRDRVAPLPIAGARRLHAELLAKKQNATVREQ